MRGQQKSHSYIHKAPQALSVCKLLDLSAEAANKYISLGDELAWRIRQSVQLSVMCV